MEMDLVDYSRAKINNALKINQFMEDSPGRGLSSTLSLSIMNQGETSSKSNGNLGIHGNFSRLPLSNKNYQHPQPPTMRIQQSYKVDQKQLAKGGYCSTKQKSVTKKMPPPAPVLKTNLMNRGGSNTAGHHKSTSTSKKGYLQAVQGHYQPQRVSGNFTCRASQNQANHYSLQQQHHQNLRMATQVDDDHLDGGFDTSSKFTPRLSGTMQTTQTQQSLLSQYQQTRNHQQQPYNSGKDLLRSNSQITKRKPPIQQQKTPTANSRRHNNQNPPQQQPSGLNLKKKPEFYHATQTSELRRLSTEQRTSSKQGDASGQKCKTNLRRGKNQDYNSVSKRVQSKNERTDKSNDRYLGGGARTYMKAQKSGGTGNRDRSYNPHYSKNNMSQLQLQLLQQKTSSISSAARQGEEKRKQASRNGTTTNLIRLKTTHANNQMSKRYFEHCSTPVKAKIELQSEPFEISPLRSSPKIKPNTESSNQQNCPRPDDVNNHHNEMISNSPRSDFMGQSLRLNAPEEPAAILDTSNQIQNNSFDGKIISYKTPDYAQSKLKIAMINLAEAASKHQQEQISSQSARIDIKSVSEQQPDCSVQSNVVDLCISRPPEKKQRGKKNIASNKNHNNNHVATDQANSKKKNFPNMIPKPKNQSIFLSRAAHNTFQKKENSILTQVLKQRDSSMKSKREMSNSSRKHIPQQLNNAQTFNKAIVRQNKDSFGALMTVQTQNSHHQNNNINQQLSFADVSPLIMTQQNSHISGNRKMTASNTNKNFLQSNHLDDQLTFTANVGPAASTMSPILLSQKFAAIPHHMTFQNRAGSGSGKSKTKTTKNKPQRDNHTRALTEPDIIFHPTMNSQMQNSTKNQKSGSNKVAKGSSLTNREPPNNSKVQSKQQEQIQKVMMQSKTPQQTHAQHLLPPPQPQGLIDEEQMLFSSNLTKKHHQTAIGNYNKSVVVNQQQKRKSIKNTNTNRKATNGLSKSPLSNTMRKQPKQKNKNDIMKQSNSSHQQTNSSIFSKNDRTIPRATLGVSCSDLSSSLANSAVQDHFMAHLDKYETNESGRQSLLGLDKSLITTIRSSLQEVSHQKVDKQERDKIVEINVDKIDLDLLNESNKDIVNQLTEQNETQKNDDVDALVLSSNSKKMSSSVRRTRSYRQKTSSRQATDSSQRSAQSVKSVSKDGNDDKPRVGTGYEISSFYPKQQRSKQSPEKNQAVVVSTRVVRRYLSKYESFEDQKEFEFSSRLQQKQSKKEKEKKQLVRSLSQKKRILYQKFLTTSAVNISIDRSKNTPEKTYDGNNNEPVLVSSASLPLILRQTEEIKEEEIILLPQEQLRQSTQETQKEKQEQTLLIENQSPEKSTPVENPEQIQNDIDKNGTPVDMSDIFYKQNDVEKSINTNLPESSSQQKQTKIQDFDSEYLQDSQTMIIDKKMEINDLEKDDINDEIQESTDLLSMPLDEMALNDEDDDLLLNVGDDNDDLLLYGDDEPDNLLMKDSTPDNAVLSLLLDEPFVQNSTPKTVKTPQQQSNFENLDSQTQMAYLTVNAQNTTLNNKNKFKGTLSIISEEKSHWILDSVQSASPLRLNQTGESQRTSLKSLMDSGFNSAQKSQSKTQISAKMSNQMMVIGGQHNFSTHLPSADGGKRPTSSRMSAEGFYQESPISPRAKFQHHQSNGCKPFGSEDVPSYTAADICVIQEENELNRSAQDNFDKEAVVTLADVNQDFNKTEAYLMSKNQIYDGKQFVEDL